MSHDAENAAAALQRLLRLESADPLGAAGMLAAVEARGAHGRPEDANAS